MQQVIRIGILNPAPLDGVTDLDVNDPGVLRRYNAQIGATEYLVQPGLSFGRFIPGNFIGAGTPQSTLSLLSVSLIPSSGAPLPGSVCRLAAPELPSSTVRTLDIADLGTNAGIFPRLIHTIPVGHKLAFETPDAGGPWMIQCVFDYVRTAQEFLSLSPAILE